jgi:hypothetical protein
MLGAFLLTYLAVHVEQSPSLFGKHAHYYIIMCLSSFVRVIVLAIFWSKIKEVREVQSISSKQLIFKIMNLRAMGGYAFGFDSRENK